LRWKLLIIISLVGTLIGVCGSVASVYVLFRLDHNVMSYELLLAAVLFPLLVALTAAVIIYRRTSRRRKLQAILTALLILLVIIATFPYALKHFSTLPDPLPMIK
jgi:cytochrome bd-type quinol oxidase subunit 2